MRHCLLCVMMTIRFIGLGAPNKLVSEATSMTTALDTSVVTNDVLSIGGRHRLWVAYSSTSWCGDRDSSDIVKLTVNGERVFEACEEGVYEWTMVKAGYYILRHEVNEKVLEKKVNVIAPTTVIEREGYNLCKLTASDDKSEIRYTVDGSEPTRGSPVYMGPFEVSPTNLTFVRACTFGEGCPQGETAMVMFERAGPLVCTAETVVAIDTRAGAETLMVDGAVGVVWSGLWDGVVTDDVLVSVDDELWFHGLGDGVASFYPEKVGDYLLTHMVKRDGEMVGVPLSARIGISPLLKVGCVKDGAAVIAIGTKEICSGAFARKNELVSVVIPSSVTNIAPTAFAGCFNIVSAESGVWPNMLHRCEPETSGWSVVGDDVYQTDQQNQYYQTLVLKAEVEGPRHASFRWKATYNGNYLRYYIDGVQQSYLRYSSEDWQEVQIDVPTGCHEVKWEYYNCSSCGDSYGWVDLSGWSYYAPARFSHLFPDSYSSIQRVAFGKDVTNLCENAFLGCESLKRVDVENMVDWLEIGFANATANPLHNGAELYVGGEKIVDLVAPEGVGNVGEYAFAGYEVESVTLSSSVTNVAPTAFAGCCNITNVILHGGVSVPRQIVPELVDGSEWVEDPEMLDEDNVYRSNVISHNQLTALEFDVPEGLEQFVFSWKVGSENNYDWLTWYLDDVQKDRISGSRGWTTLTNELDGAKHRVKFVYSKDGSASTSPDCGWVSVHASRINPPKVKDMFPDSPLVTVTIGDELEALPDDFFVGCERLEVVRLPEGFEMSRETWDSLPEKAGVRMSAGDVVWNLNNKGAIWPEAICCREVEIPASLGGLDVVKIADCAFAGCKEITALKVPEGDVAIGDGAFAGCVNLKSLILNNRFDLTGMTLRTLLPDGIAVLARLALGGAHAVLPDGFFDGCTSLSSISLPETLEDFGDNDVREIGRRGGKSGLWVQDGWVLGYIGTAPAEVTIPDGVKGIAAYAFEGQYDLERVELPDSLKFIGKDAFAGCTSLEGLDLPEGCGRIDDGAFRDCTWIQEVSLASGLTNIGAAAFANCAGLSVLIAPEGLKSMGEGAFSNCWRMVSASLPVSLDEVGENCFWNCKNLSGVTVPTHVQPLKTMFPAAYDALTSIVIAEGEDRLVEGVFDGCATVREIVLPDAVTEIPAAAFRDCVSLERMVFPAAVETIGEEAFAGCVGLTRLNLPAGLEAIGARAFEGLSELEQVAIPDGVTAIGSGAFAGCGAVRQVRLPGNVTTLAAAFPDAYKKIVRAEVPEGTTVLLAGLFDGCAALESFAIPASVTDIGARAFAGCGALKAVALPQGLKTIGGGAFSGVSGILELEIPSSVESLGAGAFTGCAALRSVTLPGDAGTLADIFPDAYEAMVSVTVTEGTETLNDGFFAGCVSLKTVVLPTSVAVIGAGAFEDCTSLASVGIPAGVTSLGAGVFRGCAALAEVTLPSGLSVLEDEVFADCALLASVTVPESVTTLGSRIFDGCTALRLVKFIGNAPQVAADAYAGTSGELVTQVATGSRGWDGIATSRNLPEFWPSGTTHGIGWWDPSRFEVTFDYNDGSGASETVEEITDTTYKLPDADPVHPGATFLGWWTEAVNGARVTPVTRVMRTGAHTLYAHWRPFSYTVTFDANGGTGTMEEQAFVFDEEQPLRACAFARIGYAFAGWAVDEGADRTIDDRETVRNLTTEDGGTVRLYAVWIEREWTAADYLGVKGMVFTSDGDADWFPDVETSHDGVGSMRSGEIGIADVGETTRSTLRTTVAGKGMLTFWWKVNCEGPDPDNGDFYDYLEFTVDGERPEAVEPIAGDVDWMKVELRIEGETPTHELAWSFVKDDWDEAPLPDIAWVDELTWTPDPVTVTFDGNGATEGSVPTAVTSAEGAELVLPGAGTLRKGPSKFVGWSDGKRVYAAGETYVVGSAGVTLSAVWEEFTIADALNTSDLVFATGGDAAWTIDFETSHDGAASMRSGAISTSQTSWIETTVDGAGTLTFVWKVDGLVYRNKTANYVQYAVDGGVPVQVAVCDWTTVEVEVEGAGEHTIRWAYLHTRAQTTGADCAWLDEVKWVEAELPKPIIEGDEGATVTGDVESGFIVKPSEGKTAVEVTIPQGVDAAKVTVEVSPKVASVKPNGAKVKIVSGGSDITEFLNVPAADGNGVVDLAKATVKEEIVKEVLDVEKGAKVELNMADPKLTTAPTHVGLFYQLREGETLGGMKDGDSTVGDGQPWLPKITVKGGNSAFYSIGVGKGK